MHDILFEPYSSSYRKCGCYIDNPASVTEKASHHALLPALESVYQIDITNAIASVSLTQTYVNPTSQFLEVTYSFPVPPKACIHKLVACFDRTRIEGEVKEKE